MILICAGALLAGLLASFFLPFLPFAASLVGAILIGGAIGLAEGRPVGGTIAMAFSILAACQVGYGLHFLGGALVGARPRSRRDRVEHPAPMRQLQSERE